MPTTNVDTAKVQRNKTRTPVKRIMQLLMASSSPAPKTQAKRPSYLRYIDYV